MAIKIKADVIIIGGGIAGLWLLNSLRQQGYQALLLEQSALGDGQTICSQGIIHGGTKYALKNNPILNQLKLMPQVWRDCLQGCGRLDLRAVKILSQQQQLFVPENLLGKFIGFLTSHAMQSRVKKLARREFPGFFAIPEFKGEVYALDEPVLDVPSLLTALSAPLADYIGKIPAPEAMQLQVKDQIIKAINITTADNTLELTAQRYIFSAGQGNAEYCRSLNLTQVAMQRRPLQMIAVKQAPANLFAHCVDYQFKPRLTFTSHHTQQGEIVWYLGGEIAEQGVHQTPAEVFAKTKTELAQLFPWLDLTTLQYRTIAIDRAEPYQANGKIPPQPFAQQYQNSIMTWPVKLAYAPMLADCVHNLMQDVQPSSSAQNFAGHLTTAKVATPLWLNETLPWN